VIIVNMSAAKTGRCLFCTFRPFTTLANIPTRRGIHATGSHQARRKRNFQSVTAEDMRLVAKGSGVKDKDATVRRAFPGYTPRERQLLALKYTPEQVEAVEAGERSINPYDVLKQGVLRKDPWALRYLDDFSKIQPLVDKPVRAYDSDVDPNIRPLTPEETEERFARHMMQYDEKVAEHEARSKNQEDYRAELQQKLEDTTIHPGDGLTTAQRLDRLRKRLEFTEGPDGQLMFESFVSNQENFLYSPKGTLNSQSNVLSQDVPKFRDRRLKSEDDDIDPRLEQVMKLTGMTKDAINKIRVKTLIVHRVVNQTRMGKIMSLYFLTIAGNENGMLGIGEGKSTEPEDGKRQSVMAAIRNMKPIPRYENRTIFGEVEAKVSASVVRLYARPPGKISA